MSRERFDPNYDLFNWVMCGFVGIFLFGICKNNFRFDWETVIVCLASGLVVASTLRDKSITYLEIRDERVLINCGYKDSGLDTVDVLSIHYVYRIPQFAAPWYGGALMVISHRDENGNIRHSALRERNYSPTTLKSFLCRVIAINPLIEIDPEYREFLNGRLELKDSSKNSVATVEQRLRDKGEVWNSVNNKLKN